MPLYIEVLKCKNKLDYLVEMVCLERGVTIKVQQQQHGVNKNQKLPIHIIVLLVGVRIGENMRFLRGLRAEQDMTAKTRRCYC